MYNMLLFSDFLIILVNTRWDTQCFPDHKLRSLNASTGNKLVPMKHNHQIALCNTVLYKKIRNTIDNSKLQGCISLQHQSHTCVLIIS